jgi:hypothetical protein
MTDETANILITYVRNARPANSHRQLFLRMRAPGSALMPTTVRDVLEHRIKLSGLELPKCAGQYLIRSMSSTRTF